SGKVSKAAIPIHHERCRRFLKNAHCRIRIDLPALNFRYVVCELPRAVAEHTAQVILYQPVRDKACLLIRHSDLDQRARGKGTELGVRYRNELGRRLVHVLSAPLATLTYVRQSAAYAYL